MEKWERKAISRVKNESALDAALLMAREHEEKTKRIKIWMDTYQRGLLPYCISHNTTGLVPGGRWLEGSVATAEGDLYLRSSLPLSFQGPIVAPNLVNRTLSAKEALFTPTVLVVLDDKVIKYRVLPNAYPEGDASKLPTFSVITVAPPIDAEVEEKKVEMRRLKKTMRLVLRIAASKGIRSLVLGTMGFGPHTRSNIRKKDRKSHQNNPAIWWWEVLTHREFFNKGLWDDIWFAVSDEWSDAQFRTSCEKNLNNREA